MLKVSVPPPSIVLTPVINRDRIITRMRKRHHHRRHPQGCHCQINASLLLLLTGSSVDCKSAAETLTLEAESVSNVTLPFDDVKDIATARNNG